MHTQFMPECVVGAMAPAYGGFDRNQSVHHHLRSPVAQTEAGRGKEKQMNISTIRTRSVLVAVLAVGAVAPAVPAAASVAPSFSALHQQAGSDYASVNSISPSTSEPSAQSGSDYSTVSAISPSTSEPSAQSGSDYSTVSAITTPSPQSGSGEAQLAGSGQATLNAITGPPTSEPSLVSGSAANAGDGFDWGDAAFGAGAALALFALSGGALLGIRRHGMSPSASTS
jgi:hypothetical protein